MTKTEALEQVRAFLASIQPYYRDDSAIMYGADGVALRLGVLKALVANDEPTAEQKWISVKEEFPPRHQNVWCCNHDGSQFEGRICAGMHAPFFTYPRGDGSPSNTVPTWIDVTHWMLLPTAPEERR